PRRALAVDPQLPLLAAGRVLLELGDVVGYVVDQVHLQLLPRPAEDLREHLAGLLHQQLAVAPGEVGRRPHGADVVPPLRAVHRGARQLAVGQLDAVLLGRLAEHAQGVVAYLVAQAARAGGDHDAHQVLLPPQHAGGGFIEDVVDDLHFEEVVARAERAALLGAAGQGAVADAVGLGAVEPAAGLGVLGVARRAQAAAQDVADALGHQLLQLLVVEVVAAALARPGPARA